MTHRVALVLSIILTLVVGTGVFAGRDRLFAPESVASSATASTAAAPSPGDNQAGQLTRTSPRIVTVTLPSTSTSASAPTSVERDERSFERDGDDHNRGEREKDDHDGEYDDD